MVSHKIERNSPTNATPDCTLHHSALQLTKCGEEEKYGFDSIDANFIHWRMRATLKHHC